MNLVNRPIRKILATDTKLVCFGAGKGLEYFVDGFRDIDVSKHIAVIVDNNRTLWDKTVELNGRKIKVIGMDQLMADTTLLDHEFILTNTYLEELMNQLGRYKALDEKNIYYYAYMLFKESDVYYRAYLPETLKLYDDSRIPKVIHYCWFGKNPMSPLNKRCLESWRRFCPEYEIIEWNETNYDYKKSKFMKEAYEAGKWAYVSDMARLDIIYHHGGIYVDTDVEIVRNLDALLYQDAFFGCEQINLIGLGLGFGAIKHCETIKKMLATYESLEFTLDKVLSGELLLPQITKGYFEEMGYVADGNYQRIDGASFYPERVLCGFDKWVGQKKITPDTYMAHHYEGSWIEKRQGVLYRRNWGLKMAEIHE